MLSQLGAGVLVLVFFMEVKTGLKVTKQLNRVKLQIYVTLCLFF